MPSVPEFVRQSVATARFLIGSIGSRPSNRSRPPMTAASKTLAAAWGRSPPSQKTPEESDVETDGDQSKLLPGVDPSVLLLTAEEDSLDGTELPHNNTLTTTPPSIHKTSSASSIEENLPGHHETGPMEASSTGSNLGHADFMASLQDVRQRVASLRDAWSLSLHSPSIRRDSSSSFAQGEEGGSSRLSLSSSIRYQTAGSHNGHSGHSSPNGHNSTASLET